MGPPGVGVWSVIGWSRGRDLSGWDAPFRREGFGGVSIKALEAATGLTSGSIYNAYGDKDGLYRAAFMATLIMTAKLNDIDPQAYLADVLARIADTPITRLEQLLPWNWTPPTVDAQAA
ncbi:transposase domain-containing protein [Inquilinus sp. Marseille-Q2685]|uniref:transposase domain-containing protein n=1 Tax=Inquilinus sp. Marseille-Q2685 TaxID=2866581 RepID=UPI0035AC0ECA